MVQLHKLSHRWDLFLSYSVLYVRDVFDRAEAPYVFGMISYCIGQHRTISDQILLNWRPRRRKCPWQLPLWRNVHLKRTLDSSSRKKLTRRESVHLRRQDETRWCRRTAGPATRHSQRALRPADIQHLSALRTLCLHADAHRAGVCGRTASPCTVLREIPLIQRWYSS